jgi:hypothetical protein
MRSIPLSHSSLVWAVDGQSGREEHMAKLLHRDGDTAVLQWSSTGNVVTVDSCCIRQVLEAGRPSRARKASQRTEIPTPVKRIKKQNDDVNPSTPSVSVPADLLMRPFSLLSP